MPKWRILLVALSVVAVLLCLYAFAGGLASGPGEGEVSVILHGGLMMVALVLAGFFALVAALFAFWDRVWVRRVLLLCTVGPVVLGAGYFGAISIKNHVADSAYRQERAAEKAEHEAWKARKAAAEQGVRPIADKYIAQLFAPSFPPENLAALEQSYAQDIVQSGIDDPAMANSDFYLKVLFDLYRYTVARAPDAPEPRPIGNGLLHEAACYEFSNAFAPRLTAPQADIFSIYCSDRAIAAGPDAMTHVR